MDLKLSDGFERRVIEAVTAEVVTAVGRRIEEEVTTTIADTIAARVDDLVGETLKNEIAAVLAQGWQKTNTYGEPTGPTLSLRDRIREAVSKFLDGRDGYSRETPAEKLTKELIKEELQGAGGEALKAAREKLREQVDAVMQAKLRESLASALGLNP